MSLAVDLGGDVSKFFRLSFKLGFHPRQTGLLLWVYHKDQLITRFEQFGIHALGLHLPGTPQSELDPEHRRFAQNLLRFADLNASEGYFYIPKKHVAFFLPKLARFGNVEFFHTGATVHFSEHPAAPIVQLKDQSGNEVHLEAHFQDSETGRPFLFSEVRIFLARRPYLLYGKTFYPIKNSIILPLLEKFNSEGKLTLKGAKAADFLQEYLPQLSTKPEVLLPQDFTVPIVEQVVPEEIAKLWEEGDRLILDLTFSYQGHPIPPHQNESDVLYELESKRLIRRDLNKETNVLRRFAEQGFQRVGLTRFETGGEKAMDYASTLPAASGDLHHFRLQGEIGIPELRARAIASGIDWLELDLHFEVDQTIIPFDVVQELFSKNQKYLSFKEKGFAKLRLDQLEELNEKFSELEARWTPEGKLRISRFHAAYLNENIQIDWSQHRELGKMIQALREIEKIPSIPLQDPLASLMREYQHHGFNWMNFLHDYRFHGILADDMGLGKTLQALAYLEEQKKRHGSAPNLVLAPTSVVFNWAQEAQKFTPHFKVVVLWGPKRKQFFTELAEADLVITSYALFRRDKDVLTALNWRTVILDEAQNIKNYRSKTASLVKQIQTEQRWALTGTPLENRLSELWSIFDFLMPGFLGSYSHFKKKFQTPIEQERSKPHLDRLRSRIFPFVLRRLKQEVAKELPPKTEITNLCEMIPEQAKIYQEVLAACRKQVFSEVEKRGIEHSQVSILTALLRLRQACCHPRLLGSKYRQSEIESGKMEFFKELVSEVVSEGHRILVFSQFVEMLGLLKEWLEQEGIRYEYLDGRTRRREERIKNFNSDSTIPIFLISLRAGGTGLNLTGADYVIHYDPWWNPAVQDQATDRAHRIGQKKHVFSYRLITKDSVEEKILMLQESKRHLAKEVLATDSGIGKRLTYEDLEFLFS